MTNEAARALSNYKGKSLTLDGLSFLSDEAAESLSKFQGDHLWLNGLSSLSENAAEALSKFPGTVSLDGITNGIG